ncbi:molybdopterin-synthase adenylyltransferase [Lachnospiraceae bacterium]|nr:molybdopterin-synthase adenylyltransferase [Lachnospiraceae bacterium]
MNCIPTQDQMKEALKLRHGEILQKKFSESRVAVCGLGGLGSNIAIALARAGVGTLILIDFDRVDISNLNRQQYKANQVGLPKTEALASNLLEIAPYLTLVTHTVRISNITWQNCSLMRTLSAKPLTWQKKKPCWSTAVWNACQTPVSLPLPVWLVLHPQMPYEPERLPNAFISAATASADRNVFPD